MAIYERHQPEKTILYQTVTRAWPKISLEHAVDGETIPRHVEAEFDRYKRCGILDYGFVRLYCKACDAERLVGFSCKGRSFCPSCGARRRDQTAERLAGDVWPVANARQWVLSFPYQVVPAAQSLCPFADRRCDRYIALYCKFLKAHQ